MIDYLLLNLSGHPAPKSAEAVFKKVISVRVPNVDMAEVTSVYDATRNLVRKAWRSANSKAKEAILRGEAAVILPDAGILAGAALVVLLGFSGNLPEFRWTVKTKDGFVLSQGLDPYQLWREGRSWRGVA